MQLEKLQLQFKMYNASYVIGNINRRRDKVFAPAVCIMLSFTAFVLEKHSNCSMDYLEIFDGVDAATATSLGR